MNGIENRLERMESLLRLSGLLSGDEVGGDDQEASERQPVNSADSSTVSPSQSTTSRQPLPTREFQSSRCSPELIAASQSKPEANLHGPPISSSLITGSYGETNFIGELTMKSWIS